MNSRNNTVNITATAVGTVISQKKPLPPSFKQHKVLRRSKFDVLLQSGACIAWSITFNDVLHLPRLLTYDACTIKLSGMEILS